MSKIGAFLNKKKMKQKSSAELFHILNLSLQDERLDMALASVEQLTTQTVKKKRVEDSNQAFLLAITKRAESIALRIYEKGFPPDCNAPVLVSAIQRTDTPKFIFPSYFLLAVAFGLSNLVNAMLKRANVNQTWYGLTPLLLASCTMGKGNHNIVNLLLENGADPSIGIQIDLFLSHKQLKIKNRPKLQQNSQYIRNYSFSSSQQSQTSTLPGFSSAPILQFGTTVPGVMESLTRFKKWSQDKVILPLDVACSAENSIAVKSLLKWCVSCLI
ncbi:hypothetical protein BKA69DRAFT_690231 [Paraphysoderma sedebokerense]|nr:hypothetical protein BKA69DRAFT_690231 [Paraphysoderma sedebokerense]